MIYGWGTKTKVWQIFGNQHIVVVWKYMHIMFLPLTLSQKWYVVKGEEDAREITYDEVRSFVPTDTPALNLWQRFGLLFGIVAIGLYALISGK